MPSKLFCVVLLLAGCKDKAADPPKQEPATQPSPDPAPAARKPELPTLDPAAAGSAKGSGDGSGAQPTADGPIQRKGQSVEATTLPAGKLSERLKQRAADLNAKRAADAKKQP